MMRFRIAAAAATLLLCQAVVAGPVVKPGLWEVTQRHADGDSEVEQECISPAQARDTSSFHQELSEDCKIGKLRDSAQEMSFDYYCASEQQSGKGRFELSVARPTEYELRYVFDGQVKVAGKTVPTQLDLQAQGRWLADDCGDLVAEDAE